MRPVINGISITSEIVESRPSHQLGSGLVRAQSSHPPRVAEERSPSSQGGELLHTTLLGSAILKPDLQVDTLNIL